jgi:hypothetical protein
MVVPGRAVCPVTAVGIARSDREAWFSALKLGLGCRVGPDRGFTGFVVGPERMRRGRIDRVDGLGRGQRAMSEGPQKSLGEMRATISREMVRLQAAYYGKGPTRAKTYIVEDLVVVVLEESFTRAEKTLAERGER